MLAQIRVRLDKRACAQASSLVCDVHSHCVAMGGAVIRIPPFQVLVASVAAADADALLRALPLGLEARSRVVLHRGLQLALASIVGGRRFGDDGLSAHIWSAMRHDGAGSAQRGRQMSIADGVTGLWAMRSMCQLVGLC
jgi:hypothetical protein